MTGKSPPYFQIKEGTGGIIPNYFLQAGLHRLPEAEVKKQLKMSKFERFIYTLAIFLVLVSPISIVFSKATLAKVNFEVEQEKKKIEKQEKTKNTKVVYCPYCGADNMLTEKVGTCKYCRRKIQATD